jgi:hypothetical protein
MDFGNLSMVSAFQRNRASVSILICGLIWGTSVSKAETTKIFLLAGQSNMVGWAYNSNLPQEYQSPRPDIQIYWNGTWTYLKPGLGGNSSCFGPEIKLCRDIVDTQPGEEIAFVKYAVSGTNLWNDWEPTSGVQYMNFMDAINDALLSISEPEIVGMLWMQGESDAWSSQSTLEHAQEYELNLTNFIHQVRNDFGVPDLPFIIARISQSSVWTWGDIVRQAQVNVSQTVPNTDMLDTNDLPLMSDAMHYNASSTITLGARFADAANAMTLPTNSFSSSMENDILSWRYKIPQDSSRVLIVGVCSEDDDPCDLLIDSIKYDYEDMNEVPGSCRQVYTDGRYIATQMFYMLENKLPAAGNYRLEINFSGNVNTRCAGAVTLSGTNQQPPYFVTTNSSQDSNDISTDVTIQSDGAWVVDIVGCNNNGVTAHDGQMTKFNIGGGNIITAGSIKLTISTGPIAVGWNLNDSNSAIVHSAAVFSTCINTISGQVRGMDDIPIEGVEINVDAVGTSAITDPDGYYEIPVIHNWSGMIEPVKEGYLFGPSKRTYNEISNNLEAQDYEDIRLYDLDGDERLDWSDVSILCDNWLSGPDAPGDFHKDGNNIVDFMDFAAFARVWNGN